MSDEQDSTPADGDEELAEVSLDDLSAAYAAAAAAHDQHAFSAVSEREHSEQHHDEIESVPLPSAAELDESVVTPETIVEAALFVGHPKNQSLSEQRLASLMRDVSPDEVNEMIVKLNASYREADQALRIVRDENGYRMTIAPQVESVRKSFLGTVREARLNQNAIEVLALAAYQPGITAQQVQDQRGRESGTILNQLVRRQLLRLERVKPVGGGRGIAHYYPTERFLVLFGLESIEDLPHVEEALRES